MESQSDWTLVIEDIMGPDLISSSMVSVHLWVLLSYYASEQSWIIVYSILNPSYSSC